MNSTIHQKTSELFMQWSEIVLASVPRKKYWTCLIPIQTKVWIVSRRKIVRKTLAPMRWLSVDEVNEYF